MKIKEGKITISGKDIVVDIPDEEIIAKAEEIRKPRMNKKKLLCTRTPEASLKAGWTFSQAIFPCDCEIAGKPLGCDGRYGKCQFQKEAGHE